LANVVVTDGVTASDVLTQEPAEIPVGSLDNQQVTAILAQTAKQTDQASDMISTDKGIGRFGLTPNQLEAAGYLKPGTVATYLQDASQLQTVLSSPTVWTGKSDVVNLDNLLADVKLQGVTQNEIMVGALQGLKQAGVVTGQEAPGELAPFVQVASRFGVDTATQWVKGQAPAELIGDISSTAKNSQFAVNLVQATDLVNNFSPPVTSFVGTTDRSTVDAAVEDIVNDPKVPLPIYSDETNEIQEVDSVTGGQETARTADVTVESNSAADRIRNLENEIASLQATIRFRQRRGLDVSAQQTQLAQLEADLAGLIFRA
jgi:hypothetical protein